MKIVHVMRFEKFIKVYIDFIDKHFDINDHLFFIIGKDYGEYDLKGLPRINFVDNYPAVLKLILKMNGCNKIILHGLWDERIMKILLMQPWLIKKCYWMMWGGDFYNHDNASPSKRKLIKKLTHFVGFIPGDFELIKKWYGSTGTFHESILYPVALHDAGKEITEKQPGQVIKILVGNSADPSNNHLEVFGKLEPYKDQDIEIIVPLSYGNTGYAEQVEKQGYEIFGSKFKPLTNFIPLDKYNSLLEEVDIGIFNHNRQQGLGNIVALLQNGKKIYMKSNISTWDMFLKSGVVVYDIAELNLDPVDPAIKQKNNAIIRHYYSTENYKNQLQNLFYSST